MKVVWALGLASVALFMGLGWYLQPLQPNIVALQFTFSPDAFQAVLDAWGAQGVQRFRLHLVIDDVLTTGATAEAVAGALRRAGAASLQLWTVAHALDPGS